MADEGTKHLKRSLKKFGCVGGIVVNEQTGFTIVGGHQKIALMDEYHKFPENDYLLRAEVINVDLATEKTLNIALNNPNVGGDWDYDKLRQIIPDIDYKAAGLTDVDLNMIGVDFMLETEEQNNIANELDTLNAPIRQDAEQQRQIRAEQRRLQAEEEEDVDEDAPPTEEEIQQARIAHMKDVKQQVRQQAIQNAQNMDAYVMLSFSDYDSKVRFCMRFGYEPETKFIKGEIFDEQVERVD